MRKSKHYIFWSLIFFFGFLVGVFATSLLMREVRPTFVKMIQSGLVTEQEFLAAKASRENRMFDSTIHRWVAVSAASDDGFRIFREDQNYYNNESIFFPFELMAFKGMYSTESFIKGQKIIEGINRGKLAIALNAIDQNSLALKQWEKAHSLVGMPSVEKLKKSVRLLIEQEKTELHLDAEDVVLGKRK